MFSFFKGSSQTAESHVYLPRSYSFTKQKFFLSLEILSSQGLRLLADSQLFSTVIIVSSGRGTSATD